MAQLLESHTGDLVAGQRLKNSPWTNSGIVGAIDETTEVSLKDDFHTAVNKEWILSQDISESNSTSVLHQDNEVLQEQILNLFTENETVKDPSILSQEQVDHLQQMLFTMSELAGNWEKRNALGVEPLRPYLDHIQSIETLDDLTAYLAGKRGPLLIRGQLMNAEVNYPFSDRSSYTVHLTEPSELLMEDPYSYYSLANQKFLILQEQTEAVSKVMVQLGYTDQQVRKLVNQC